MRIAAMSTRVTFRHMPLVEQAMCALAASSNDPAPTVPFLDMCLRVCEKALRGTCGDSAERNLEADIREVLKTAALADGNGTSPRVRYAFAILHLVERALGFTLLDRKGRHGRTQRLVISNERQRGQRCGTYGTPDAICHTMVKELTDHLVGDRRRSADVLDLSVEAGHFPLTFAVNRPNSLNIRFFGIDKDPNAVQVARGIIDFAMAGKTTRNYKVHTLVQDSLLDPFPPRWPRRFDAIVGNPPWRRRQSADFQIIRQRSYPLLQGVDESYLAFMLRAHELLRPGGYLTYVVPSAFLFNLNASPIRQLLLKEYELINLRIFPQRSFVEVPCIIPISFLARKRLGRRNKRVATEVAYQETRLGGPDRPQGIHKSDFVKIWCRLPGHVINPVAQPEYEFLLEGLPGRTLNEFGRVHLGLRFARGKEALRPPCSFRGIHARNIRSFHVCLRNTNIHKATQARFDPAPQMTHVLAEKVVFQELRYMTHRQRLVAGVAGPGTFPVSTASMFLPTWRDGSIFFAALLNSALANAWYKLRDVSRSIKLDYIRDLPVVHDQQAWQLIARLGRTCMNLRATLHRNLHVCTLPNEERTLARRFPGLYANLRECLWEIDHSIFELYCLPKRQRQIVLELAAKRVF